MFQTVEAKDATLVKTDSSKEFCDVCGMHLTKYYKTSHTAEFKMVIKNSIVLFIV